jgi:D-alanyl-D-alanine dipeptidase
MRHSHSRAVLLALAIVVGATLAAVACAPSHRSALVPTTTALALLPGPKPAAASTFHDEVGEYDSGTGVLFILEADNTLWLVDTARATGKRTALWTVEFIGPNGPVNNGGPGAVMLHFAPDATGRRVPSRVGDVVLTRRSVGPQAGSNQLRVTPVRSIEDVRREALAASPPAEPPAAHNPDLVELTSLDPTITLEIRYATTNNFLGTRFYDEARAFMQRSAAEAVVRANQRLRQLGYGLLIHDAYRPWYVTKMFWDATPLDKRWLVANPAQGSKHNRGAAVDLTLFDLATGQPVEMPSTYDESTGRAFADYPGGTSLQRWHRALLRNAMVAEGFLVNPSEWWHFDYRSWRDYPLGNVAFDRIGR